MFFAKNVSKSIFGKIILSLSMGTVLYGSNIELKSGWNLVGTNSNIENVNTTIPSASLVWKFQNNNWLASSPNQEFSTQAFQDANVSTFESLNAGDGFWVLMSGDKNISLPDSNLTNSFNLKTGWNLLSIKSNQDINVSDYFNESDINIVWKFQDNNWFGYSPRLSMKLAIEKYNFQTFEKLKVNQGFWVVSKANKNLTNSIDINSSVKIDENITRADAIRFLRQASFRSSETDITYLISNGYEAWIDNQFSLVGDLDNNTDEKYGYLESMFRTLNKIDSDKYPAKIFADPTKLDEKNLDITRINVFRGSVFWQKALENENQLRQRLTYALSQILVTSDVSPVGLAIRFRGESSATYYDILYKHSFGNYRNLLTDVTHSSAMGYFLTYIGSKKDAPDENYARELTQLFTVGLYELELDGTKKLDSKGNPIPSYDQQHVTDLAKVFTGWDLDDKQENSRGDFSRYGSTGKTDNSWSSPLQFNLKYHDVNSTLDLIGDITMKTSSNGSADIENALNILFANRNVAPYISRNLIMRFVTSNPTPDYIKRVATKFNDNGFGVKGDLKAVIKAILLDPEARKGDVANFGKVDEMTVALPHILHSFNSKPIPSMKFGKQEVKNIYWLSTDRTFGQAVLSADSVFNFYSNEFIPSDPAFANTNLVAPELQTQTTPSLIEFNNLLKNLFITKEKYLQVDIGKYTNIKAWSDARKFAKFTLAQGLLYLDLTPEYNILEKALDNKEIADGNFTNMGDSNTHIEDRERAIRSLLAHLGNKLFGKPIPETYVTAMITHFEKMSFPKSNAGRQNRAKMIVTTSVQAIVTSQLYMVLR